MCKIFGTLALQLIIMHIEIIVKKYKDLLIGEMIKFYQSYGKETRLIKKLSIKNIY